MSENNSSEENVTRAFIEEKLDKITENSASVETSVKEFVKSSSEILNALSVAVSEDTLGRLKDFLEKSEEFFKKNVLDNSVSVLTDENEERRYQKFLKDLAYFETNLENGLSDKFNDLNEYQHVMLEEIKKAFSNFSDSLENDKDELFVSAASDIKQIKADMTELSGQLGTFNVLAKERAENLNKQTENAVNETGRGLLSEIRLMRAENATAEFVKSAYEQTSFRIRNEVNLLKTELTQQLHRILGKTSVWDELKFTSEETVRAIKNNITETGILKKYLKDVKGASDLNTESLAVLKDAMRVLAESGLSDLSDKVDVIYDNITFLNAIASSSDSLSGNLNSFGTKLETGLDKISEKLDELTNKSEVQPESYSDNLKTLEDIAESVKSVKAQTESFNAIENLLNNANEIIGNINETLKSTANKTDEVCSMLSNADFGNGENLPDNTGADILQNISDLQGIFTNAEGLLEETAEKIDIIYENLDALNEQRIKDDEFEKDFARFKESMETGLSSVNDRLTELNEIRENSSAIIEETAEKTDIIYENLNALNSEREKTDKFIADFEEFRDNFTKSFNEADEKITSLKEFVSNSRNLTGDLELIKDKFCADCERIANDLSEAMQNFDPEKLKIKNIEILGFDNFAAVLTEKMKETALKTEEVLNILSTPQSWANEENTSEKLDDVFIQISKISDKLESVSETFKSALDEQVDFNERITDLEKSVNGAVDNIVSAASDVNRTSVATIAEISQTVNEKLAFTANDISEKINSALDKMSEETQRHGTTTLAEVTSTVAKVSEDLKNTENAILKAIKSDDHALGADSEETDSLLKNIRERIEALYSINGTLDNIMLAMNDDSSKSEEIIEEIRLIKEKLNNRTTAGEIVEENEDIQNRFDELKRGFEETAAQNCETLTLAIKENTEGIGTLLNHFDEVKNCVDKISATTNLPTDIYNGIKSGAIKTERILKTVSELSKRLENLKPLTSNIESILHKTGVGFGKAKEAYQKLEELKAYVEKTGEFVGHTDEICRTANENSEKIDGMYAELNELKTKISILDSIDEDLRNLINVVQMSSDRASFEDLADTLSLGIESILAQLKEAGSFYTVFEHKISNLENDVANVNRSTSLFSANIIKFNKLLNNFGKDTDKNGINELKKRLDGIRGSVTNSEEYSQILLESFGYLADWIDKAGICLNDILSEIKKSGANNKALAKNVDNIGNGIVALLEDGISTDYIKKLHKELKNTNNNIKDLKVDISDAISNKISDLKENIAQNLPERVDFSEISEDLATVKEFADKFTKKDSFENIKNALKLIVKTMDDKFAENGKQIKEIASVVASGSNGNDITEKLKEVIDKSEQTVQLFENNQNMINNLELKIENVDLKLASFDQRMTSLEGNISKLISYLEDDE